MFCGLATQELPGQQFVRVCFFFLFLRYPQSATIIRFAPSAHLGRPSPHLQSHFTFKDSSLFTPLIPPPLLL